jgi:hypothetical protein
MAICGTCAGTGRGPCLMCNGTGYRPKPGGKPGETGQCPTCGGSGQATCYQCGGSGGSYGS